MLNHPLPTRRMQFTFFVPDLLWPEPEEHSVFDKLATPALNRLLAIGHCTQQPKQPYEAALATLFGGKQTASYAALRHRGETGNADAPNVSPDDAASDEANWLCCDPVHLRFEQEHLLLADAGHIGLTLDEAQALAATLNEELADWGHFILTASGRGYLRLAAGKRRSDFGDAGPPLSAVAGRRVETLLADAHGDQLRLFNEIQMLLHDHPVNRQRESSGRPAINACWLWGAHPPFSADDGNNGGASRAASAPPTRALFDRLWSDDPLARGLAHTGGLLSAPLPDSFPAVLSNTAANAASTQASRVQHGLVTFDTLLVPTRYEDGESWRTALLDLEARWFAPALAALATGHISALTIIAPTAYAVPHWRIERRDRWKFWRRPQTLAQIAGTLAEREHLERLEQLEQPARQEPAH